MEAERASRVYFYERFTTGAKYNMSVQTKTSFQQVLLKLISTKQHVQLCGSSSHTMTKAVKITSRQFRWRG